MANPTDIKPPFTLETAKAKVQAAENAWNTRNPERVVLAYTKDSKWRNRNEFINAVTLDDINRVAKELLRPEDLHFVVVGQPEGLNP